MKKILGALAITTLLLTGCEEEPQPTYVKETGEVVGKHVTGGRWGNTYYINVSYPKGENNRFAIDEVDVDKDLYDKMQIKQKVTVYVNENGIGELVQ